MQTMETSDPLTRGGYNPLRGLGGRAPERLPETRHEDDPDDLRGIYIGCEEAADILGMGRTQVWRLAKHRDIRRKVTGTRNGDIITKVAAVEEGAVILRRRLAKKWQIQPVTIGGKRFTVTAFEGNRLEVAEPTDAIRVKSRVLVPKGRIARPVYLLHKEDVEAYHRERQAKRLKLRIEDMQDAYRRLLSLYGTGLPRAAVTEIARESARESERQRAIA